MARVEKNHTPAEWDYQKYFPRVIIGLVITILLLISSLSFIFYQLVYRPLPVFSAVTPKGEVIPLSVYLEPNLMPNTIITWASKAAINVYTFRFSATNDEVYSRIYPYFTYDGGISFYQSVLGLLQTLRQNQVNTNCTVTGQPVISNQGDYGNFGMTWRVQIPFLVTYEAAGKFNTTRQRVTLYVVKVPTTTNPRGIGIEQFLM